MRPLPRASCLALCLLFPPGLSLSAAETTETKFAPAGAKILFDRDVQPIFAQSCLRCHGPEKPKSDFRLDTRGEALKGGNDNTNDIVPGWSDQSKLIAYVAGSDPEIRMPPTNRGPPLTPAQVALLRAWIDQGADWGTNAAPPPLTFSLAPTLGWIGVAGDNKKFSELENSSKGWSGGVEHFSYTEQFAPDRKLAGEGHALPQQHDFKVTLALDQKDFGFVHSGFEEWRRYFDDTGGFYPLFSPSSFSLNQDWHLDLGRAWIDFGLTLPDTPRVIFGYEYQFRQGTKSTLIWGPVTQGVTTKNIYPDPESVNERTHIFKMDLSREWNGWSLADRGRVEFYKLSDQRNDAVSYTAGPRPDVLERINQGVNYSQGMNTLRLERQITDWWRASVGSLLTVFDGTSSFNQATTDGAGQPVFGQFWRTEGVTLHRDSYAFSGSSLFLPLKGLTLSVAAQGEWAHENGFGNVALDVGQPGMPFYTPFPGQVSANQDRTTASENIDLRYTGLSHTVLFAQGRLQQESVGQYENATNGTVDTVQERTDAMNYLYDTRVGFTSSPRFWIEWGGHYRYRDSNTSYSHLLDTTPGYPAFITHRDMATDEIEGRLVLRPNSWLTTRLTWQWWETEFSSTTEPVPGAPPISPGGPLQDGSTVANNAGLSLIFTPVPRFYFSSSLTYTHTRTTTAGEQDPTIVPYRGDIYTVGASAGYAFNAKTRLNATYTFSQSDYGQNNDAGLPFGIDFTRHELLIGLTHQFSARLAGTLRYRFSQYLEPSNGNVNDYTAHGIFATLSYRWP
ncbi:MAG TPA: c-type cytochrome domain-containing protein [Candidatus Acidoferrum sp.]|nr:c-type cytochrome domain-containing protein [Candidatus Acidoferrum sp.]